MVPTVYWRSCVFNGYLQEKHKLSWTCKLSVNVKLFTCLIRSDIIRCRMFVGRNSLSFRLFVRYNYQQNKMVVLSDVSPLLVEIDPLVLEFPIFLPFQRIITSNVFIWFSKKSYWKSLCLTGVLHYCPSIMYCVGVTDIKSCSLTQCQTLL